MFNCEYNQVTSLISATVYLMIIWLWMTKKSLINSEESTPCVVSYFYFSPRARN